jgi:hypothetical protein
MPNIKYKTPRIMIVARWSIEIFSSELKIEKYADKTTNRNAISAPFPSFKELGSC